MSSTELPRHIVDRFERRWAKKLEQQARAWKSVRSESRSLTNQGIPRHSTGAALPAATKIDLRGSVCFCRYDTLIAPASRMLEHNFNPVVVSVMTDPIEEIVAPAAIERRHQRLRAIQGPRSLRA